MQDKIDYYLIVTTIDETPAQYKVHKFPKKFGQFECFEAFKYNANRIGTTPKWEFVTKPVYIPVHRVKNMLLIKHHVNDSSKDGNSYQFKD